MADNRILFQIPHMHYMASRSSNIWAKNLAKAFALAGISPTIQYLGSKHFQKKIISGVNYISLPVIQSWMMGIPRLRSTIVKTIQTYYIRNCGIKFSLISPLRGPYSIADEIRKVTAVKDSGAKYLFTVVEHPKRNAGTDNLECVSQYLNSTANMYDIIMPITTYIKDMYIEHGRTKPIFLNPIIVDTAEFSYFSKEANAKTTHFLYCGNLLYTEEMEILFREFSIVRNEYSDSILEVVGGGVNINSTKALLKKYKLLCQNLKIDNSVTFTGNLSHTEVLKHYGKADAFLLPRPFRDYSKAGFPTKLGEYLATGKPVIAFGTGDLPLYLDDGVSAYLVMDESIGKFAEKIIEVIQDNSSNAVGNRGANTAEKEFSIPATAARIQTFFENNPSLLC